MTYIIKVADIDWNNFNITRAGILPIYRSYIGLNISKGTGTVATLGGQSEDNDINLIHTAYREYIEEFGDTKKLKYLYSKDFLTLKDLCECTAIVNDYSLTIIVPVSELTIEFIPSIEVYDFVWINVNQLQKLRQKSYKKNSIKYSYDLNFIVNYFTIIKPYINNTERNILFDKNEYINILNKQYIQPQINIDIKDYSLEEFKKVFKETPNVNWLSTYIYSTYKDKIYIMDKYKKIYIIKNINNNFFQCMKLIFKVAVVIYVPDDRTLNILMKFNKSLKSSKIVFINIHKKLSVLPLNIKNEFFNKLNNSNNIYNTLFLMHEIELYVYENSNKNKSLFDCNRTLIRYIMIKLVDINNKYNIYLYKTFAEKEKIKLLNIIEQYGLNNKINLNDIEMLLLK